MSDNANTIPEFTDMSSESDDPFTKTAVLPEDVRVRARVSEDRLQVGSVLRDRFMLQERVAGGGMGVVYKALDRRLAEVDGVEPWVAIKVLSTQLAGNAQALRALQQEAAKGRCLTHPNIVRFIDFDREDNMYFIVMEWLEGRSLAAELDASDRVLEQKAALDIIRQIGEALGYAHRCGVVHADVKPGNIMLLPTGVVKLFDFGIARVRQQQGSDRDADPGILSAATPAYSSMQVLTGEEPVATDDVFSLGCLAYRLLAGHRVFGPRNAAEAAERGMEPQRPQNLGDGQWQALRKSLAHSRVARYASTAEFLEALLDGAAASGRQSKEFRDEPLIVPREEITKRRYAERRRVWPLLMLILAGSATALVMLRPAWIGDGVDRAQAWWIELQAGGALSVGEPPAAGSDEKVSSPAASAAQEQPGAAVPTLEIVEPAVTDETQRVTDDGAPAPGNVTATESQTQDSAAQTLDAPSTAAPDGGSDAAPSLIGGEEPVAAPPDAAAQASLAEGEGSASLVLAAPGAAHTELDLLLNEGAAPLVVDVYRWFDLSEALTVRIDEVGFSGNRAPRDAGQYALSGDGVLSFDPGQRRTTLEIAMPDDALREPDQQVSLLLRDYYNVGAELGQLNISLLDDDQRAFEANHEVNTVTFATSQLSVPERDPAVQVDVLRLNPDQRDLTVRYRIDEVSATDGQDFFSPTRQLLTFGPGQRTVRLLIPLVQDSQAEADEAFTIELNVADGGANTFRRVAVIIRDDD